MPTRDSAMPLSIEHPMQAVVAELLRRSSAGNLALLNGDLRGFANLVPHSDDYTLMSPFGGTPTHGFDRSDEHLAELARFFRSGAGTLDLVQSYATPDMVVLVVIERQRACVGDLAEQDWSLRVTLVYRRCSSERGAWELVHRHADSLVRGISLAQAAELARGYSL
jgi:ketosteroid isomerase-like protein